MKHKIKTENVLTICSDTACAPITFGELMSVAELITGESFSIDWLDWYSRQIADHVFAQYPQMKEDVELLNSLKHNEQDIEEFTAKMVEKYGAEIEVEQMSSPFTPSATEQYQHKIKLETTINGRN